MGGFNAIACGSKSKSKAKMARDDGIQESLRKMTNKLLIMSGKGGVGKTSVSVNLAISLANLGFRVGLMDVDIHGPDVPRMLGLDVILQVDQNRKMIPASYSDKLKIVSIETLISGKDDAIIWRGPMKYSAIKQFICDVEWGKLDFLIIDSPPGTGDEPLTIAQTIPDVEAIIVTTPQEISLADVRKSISFCKSVKMGIFGMIENMSGFVCPRCGEILHLFGSGGGEKTALAAGIPFLGRIPFDPNVVLCGDAGISFQKVYSHSVVAKVFIDIAKKISAQKNDKTIKTGEMIL